MYVLYYSPGSASFAVHWLLIELGAPFEARRLDLDAREHKSPEYLRLNPNGLVPTLLIDGQPVFESAALLTLLAERHPEAGFAPATGSAARIPYVQWMFHLANTLQPAFRNWFYPEGAAGATNVDAARESARRDRGGLGPVEAQLGSAGRDVWRLDQRAGFLATMLMLVAQHAAAATNWPAIANYVARLNRGPRSAS